NGEQSVRLYANANHTLPQQTLWVSTTGSDTTGNGTQQKPFASILYATTVAQSGATIYLTAGTYPMAGRAVGGNLNDRWITITAAPGVAKRNVIVQPNGAYLKVNRLAVSGVSIDCLSPGTFVGNLPWWSDTQLWLDGVEISSSLGMAQEIPSPIESNWAAAYITNSIIHDYPGRAIVANDVPIVRNVQISNISDDAIDNPQLVINTSIDGVLAANEGAHIDAIQWFIDRADANGILFNVKATNLGVGQL